MARDEQVARGIERRGFGLMSPELGLRAMERVLDHNVAQPLLFAGNWSETARLNYPLGTPALLDQVLQDEATRDAPASDDDDVSVRDSLTELAALPDLGQRRTALEAILSDIAAKVFRCDRSMIEPDEPLVRLGLDSMLALELRGRIAGFLGVSPSIVQLLQGESVASIAEALAPRVVPAAPRDVQDLVAELAAFPDRQAEAILDNLTTDS